MSTVAKQIQTLLKNSGQLARVPRRSTIRERVAAGQYLYITATPGAPASGPDNLRDHNGNPVALVPEDGRAAEAPTVVGVVMARKLNWYLGEVRHLTVAPEFRGRGLGRSLFNMAEAKLKAARARVIIGTDSSDDHEHTAEQYGFDSEGAEAVTFDNSSGRNVAVLFKNI